MGRTPPAHKLGLSLSSADYVAATCWLDGVYNEPLAGETLSPKVGSKWSSLLCSEGSEGYTTNAGSVSSSLNKVNPDQLHFDSSLAAAKLAMAGSGSGADAVLCAVKKLTPLCTANLKLVDLLAPVPAYLQIGHSATKPAPTSAIMEESATAADIAASQAASRIPVPGHPVLSKSKGSSSAGSWGAKPSEPLNIPKRAGSTALKETGRKASPQHHRVHESPQPLPLGGLSTALGTWAERKRTHDMPSPLTAKEAGGSTHGKHRGRTVGFKLRHLLHGPPVIPVNEPEAREAEAPKKPVTYWAPDAHAGDRPQGRVGLRKPTEAARRELASLDLLTGAAREQAAWRIRFKRKWILEEIHALRKVFPADDPGYLDVWDDALQLIGACGPGVNLQVDTTVKFLELAEHRGFHVEEGLEGRIGPESELFFELEPELTGPSAEALVSLESFMGGAEDASQNPFRAVHEARRRDQAAPPAQLGAPNKPLQTMGTAAEELVKQQKAFEEDARKAWSHTAPAWDYAPPKTMARNMPPALPTVAKTMEWSDFVI